MLFSSCNESRSDNACVPGMQISCPCLDGHDSVQRCLESGTFGECACDHDSGDAGERDMPDADRGGRAEEPVTAAGRSAAGSGGRSAAGSGGRPGSSAGSGGKPASEAGSGGKTGANAGSGGAGGSQPPASVMPSNPKMLRADTGSLIAAFPTEHGIVLVLSTGVHLFDREGKELARWDDARAIATAALDGNMLGVADGAIVTGLDVSDKLREVSSTQLVEACTASVMISDGRFVCGPANDWDRVFYTYDLGSGKLLASSNKFTYNGRPMRRVPGTNKFVTVSDDLSPSDFHLYSVGDDHTAVYLGESPYHGDFRVTNNYAFDGAPPTHLITDTGLLLDIGRADCQQGQAPMFNGMVAGCFVKDGALGTLTGAQSFLAMSNQGGTVYALVDTGSAAAPGATTRTLLLQSIDVAAREVRSQSNYALSQNLVRVVALDFDAQTSKILLALALVTSDGTGQNAQSKYSVELLSL